jgi:hypothetical protein
MITVGNGVRNRPFWLTRTFYSGTIIRLVANCWSWALNFRKELDVAFLSPIIKHLLFVAVILGIFVLGAVFKDRTIFSNSSFSVGGGELAFVIAIVFCAIAWSPAGKDSPKNGS